MPFIRFASPLWLGVWFWSAYLTGAFAADKPSRTDRVPPPALSEEENNARVLQFLEQRVKRDPDDITALNRIASIHLRSLRETGDLNELALASVAAAQSLKAVPEVNPGGLAVQARVDFDSHRFAQARDEALRLTHTAAERPDGFQILGDALFELGEPEQALAAWQQMEQRLDDGGPDLEVRLARLHWLHGELDAARDSFTKALRIARLIEPAQPQTVLWCLIQRGQLAFGRGDWDSAETDYAEARQLAPANYSVLDHVGELRAAQKKYGEAETIYQQVVAQTSRPEFMQILGDIYTFAGQPGDAKPWHDRALAAYLKSVNEGSVQYFHHLAAFYADIQPDPAQALLFARRDMETRHSVLAYDALAWALYQNGEWAAAKDAAQKAMMLGTRDAHLLYHAGMIFSRAGDLTRGGDILREVAVINPKYFNSFHVHR